MTRSFELSVNGETHKVEVEPKTPLLYVLRNDLALNGAKFGCGLGQCGACTINIDGRAVRSCITPVAVVAGRKITTVESHDSPTLAALQDAFVAEQAMQCGYCISGMIMTAKAFIDGGGKATDENIREALSPNLCRCGSHNRIVRAVARAAGVAGERGAT